MDSGLPQRNAWERRRESRKTPERSCAAMSRRESGRAGSSSTFSDPAPSRPSPSGRAIGEIQMHLFAQPPFGANAVAYRKHSVGLTPKKRPDLVGDLLSVRLQGKVPGIEETNRGIRDIALERFRSGRQEERIVLTPHREERWLARAEVVLKGGVQGDVALVVAEEIQLHLIRTRTREVEIVQGVAIRRDLQGVRNAMGVLPVRCLRFQQVSQCFSIRLGCIPPISAYRIPSLA